MQVTCYALLQDRRCAIRVYCLFVRFGIPWGNWELQLCDLVRVAAGISEGDVRTEFTREDLEFVCNWKTICGQQFCASSGSKKTRAGEIGDQLLLRLRCVGPPLTIPDGFSTPSTPPNQLPTPPCSPIGARPDQDVRFPGVFTFSNLYFSF